MTRFRVARHEFTDTTPSFGGDDLPALVIGGKPTAIDGWTSILMLKRARAVGEERPEEFLIRAGMVIHRLLHSSGSGRSLSMGTFSRLSRLHGHQNPDSRLPSPDSLHEEFNWRTVTPTCFRVKPFDDRIEGLLC